MLNRNITQRGTQATDSQDGRPYCLPVNVGGSLFIYTNDDLRNHTNQRRQHTIWTREDNQLALRCYFRNNPILKGYRKRMIEIWQECASFQTTSQRF